MMTPKQAYMNDVEKESSQHLKSALISLYEFGFINFDENKELMAKYGNVEQVACVLCENLMIKSTF